MRPLLAQYGISPDGTAIIESAKACGITLMNQAERDLTVATTYGVGELIVHAIGQGCRKFIIGLGGSGTSDNGIGMLQALADHFTANQSIDELPECNIPKCHFILASDVRNPLYGKEGAAYTFAPQKGANSHTIELLEKRAIEFARHSALKLKRDASLIPGAGAAGGLGYAFIQYFEANIQSGADLLLDLIQFDKEIAGSDLIITGEGHADRQTLMGKLPERVLRRAQRQHIPVWLIAGQASDTAELLSAGFDRVENLTPDNMPIEEAIQPQTARRNIKRWVQYADL